MQTSFHINGLWFHVSWNLTGTIGIDQRGLTWFNKSSPISELGNKPTDSAVQKSQGWISNDDLFMQERESRFSFHKQRMIVTNNY